jgi:predicted nuclease of predicted toxin-antitoxin system
MKLLLDMGVAPRTAEFLRMHGHDAVHLRELGLVKLPDPEIVRLAERENRVIVTFDLDFSRIVALGRLAQPSVILFRLDQFTTDEIQKQLVELLRQVSSDLEAGAIVVVDSERVRVRRLPIL